MKKRFTNREKACATDWLMYMIAVVVIVSIMFGW